MDRVEYLLRLTHDHCDDGDVIRQRQINENAAHARRTMELLEIARGLVQLLEQDLQNGFGRYLPQAPQQVSPVRRIPETEPTPRAVQAGPRKAEG